MIIDLTQDKLFSSEVQAINNIKFAPNDWNFVENSWNNLVLAEIPELRSIFDFAKELINKYANNRVDPDSLIAYQQLDSEALLLYKGAIRPWLNYEESDSLFEAIYRPISRQIKTYPDSEPFIGKFPREDGESINLTLCKDQELWKIQIISAFVHTILHGPLFGRHDYHDYDNKKNAHGFAEFEKSFTGIFNKFTKPSLFSNWSGMRDYNRIGFHTGGLLSIIFDDKYLGIALIVDED